MDALGVVAAVPAFASASAQLTDYAACEPTAALLSTTAVPGRRRSQAPLCHQGELSQLCDRSAGRLLLSMAVPAEPWPALRFTCCTPSRLARLKTLKVALCPPICPMQPKRGTAAKAKASDKQ